MLKKHKYIEDFGLIHRRSRRNDSDLSFFASSGRLYDPTIAKFLSPDPFIQNPYNTQNFNRYSYVMNNPYLYIDPSGYITLSIFGIATFTTEAGENQDEWDLSWNSGNDNDNRVENRIENFHTIPNAEPTNIFDQVILDQDQRINMFPEEYSYTAFDVPETNQVDFGDLMYQGLEGASYAAIATYKKTKSPYVVAGSAVFGFNAGIYEKLIYETSGINRIREKTIHDFYHVNTNNQFTNPAISYGF